MCVNVCVRVRVLVRVRVRARARVRVRVRVRVCLRVRVRVRVLSSYCIPYVRMLMAVFPLRLAERRHRASTSSSLGRKIQ